MGAIFPYPCRRTRLDNGLTTLLVPMGSEGLVSFWTIVRTGSRDEHEPGRTGFAHFFEHMMFRGTERFPQERYNRIVTEMGADANAYTTDDLTAYHLSVTSDDLERTLEIESDRFQHLSYSEEAFRTEAGAVHGEYRKSRTSPFFTVYEAVREAAFRVHTYGHTTMGRLEDIRAMPELYEYSRAFFSRFYRPDNVVLLAAGDIEPDRTLELVRRHYGSWEPGYRPPELESEPEQREERRLEVTYEGRTLPILWMAYRAERFDPGDRRWLASLLLCDLAFGETSDVYRKLVLEERAVEFVEAELRWTRDPGLVDLVARIKEPGGVDRVEAELDRVSRQYREELPDPGRLEDLKSRLRYAFLMGLDTPDRVSASLARTVALTGGIEAVDRLHATLATIRPEEVRLAARRILDPSRRTVAVLRGES
jgi:zinc protease